DWIDHILSPWVPQEGHVCEDGQLGARSARSRRNFRAPGGLDASISIRCIDTADRLFAGILADTWERPARDAPDSCGLSGRRVSLGKRGTSGHLRRARFEPRQFVRTDRTAAAIVGTLLVAPAPGCGSGQRPRRR